MSLLHFPLLFRRTSAMKTTYCQRALRLSRAETSLVRAQGPSPAVAVEDGVTWLLQQI